MKNILWHVKEVRKFITKEMDKEKGKEGKEDNAKEKKKNVDLNENDDDFER